MSGFGIGWIVAGGFLLGMSVSHIILFGSILATFGVIMIAIGLVKLFDKSNYARKREKRRKNRN